MKRHNLFTCILALSLITTIRNTQALNLCLHTIRYSKSYFHNNRFWYNKLRFHRPQYISTYFNSNEGHGEDLNFKQNIEELLPEFFRENNKALKKLQQGKHELVVSIGQTGAAKSTLIGALLGNKLHLEEITKKIEPSDGEELSIKKEVIENINPDGPKIGHDTIEPETVFAQAYLDQETNLAFVDTAGLGDTREKGEAINACSAIGIRTLFEKTGSLKCILAVLEYNLFNAERGSDAFTNLLMAISAMLNDNPHKKITSSIVLAFTKVPSHIKEEDIVKLLKERCIDLLQKTDTDRVGDTLEANVVENMLLRNMYESFFPDYCGIKDEQNVPFFLIKEEDLVEVGCVRNKMLPTIENAKKIDAKNIGLALPKYLKQKTIDWITKIGISVAKEIKDDKVNQAQIDDQQEKISFMNEKKSRGEGLLKQLEDPNNKTIQNKFLKTTVQENNKRNKQLDRKIKGNREDRNLKITAKDLVNTNEVIFYKKLSSKYDQQKRQHEYNYNDVSIDYITYNENGPKDPTLGKRLSFGYSVVGITKKYHKGILNITVENNLHKIYGISKLIAPLLSWGIGAGWPLLFPSFFYMHNLLGPSDFYIYAQKKHIYHNNIASLSDDIKLLDEYYFAWEREKKRLEAENKFIETLLKKDVATEKEIINQVKININTISAEIKEIQYDLHKHINNKKKINERIAHIIIELSPFMKFHENFDLYLKILSEYVETKQQGASST